MDRPLSQLKAPELLFQRREERPRCGKQRVVFLEAGEIQHRLSVQLVSGHAIPDALHCLRNGPPNRGAHLFELRPHRLGLRSNVLVNRLGNASFHTPILCLCMWFFLADIRLTSPSLRRSLPHCQRAPLHRVVLRGTMSGHTTWTRSRRLGLWPSALRVAMSGDTSCLVAKDLPTAACGARTSRAPPTWSAR